MRARSLPRYATTYALVGVVLCAARKARSEPGRVSLRIDCPSLGGDTSAALEARAEAELVSEPLPDGEVSIACTPTTVILRWAPAADQPREEQIDLAKVSGAIDDAILVGLHALLADGERTAPARPAPPTVVEQPPEPPPPTPADGPRETSHPIRIAGVVGTDAEIWHGGIGVAVGARAGIVLLPWKRWTFSLVVAPQWGVGSTDGVSAWGLRVTARVDYAVVSQLALRLAVSGRGLWASAQGAVADQLEGTTAGALLGARYVLALGPVRLSLGPSVEILARPIVVDVAGTEVLRVPSFVGGVSLEGAAP